VNNHAGNPECGSVAAGELTHEDKQSLVFTHETIFVCGGDGGGSLSHKSKNGYFSKLGIFLPYDWANDF